MSDEDSALYWVIPIIALLTVAVMVVVAVDVRASLPEREIPIPLPIFKIVSLGNPYILHCDPTTEFAPDKLIRNSTHTFNHVICEWENRN